MDKKKELQNEQLDDVNGGYVPHNTNDEAKPVPTDAVGFVPEYEENN